MIGQMRHKITFRTPVSTPVGGGGVETTYVDSLSDWSEAQPLKATRDLAQYQTEIKTGYRFTIRYRKGWEPDKSMIIIYDGRQFTVNSIFPDIENQQRLWRIVGMEKL